MASHPSPGMPFLFFASAFASASPAHHPAIERLRARVCYPQTILDRQDAKISRVPTSRISRDSSRARSYSVTLDSRRIHPVTLRLDHTPGSTRALRNRGVIAPSPPDGTLADPTPGASRESPGENRRASLRSPDHRAALSPQGAGACASVRGEGMGNKRRCREGGRIKRSPNQTRLGLRNRAKKGARILHSDRYRARLGGSNAQLDVSWSSDLVP
jgi:hypothetical protein